MEGNIERGNWSWWVVMAGYFDSAVTYPHSLGPAHAVYFATYEAVKQAMGGNKGNEHHPLAAGTSP